MAVSLILLLACAAGHHHPTAPLVLGTTAAFGVPFPIVPGMAVIDEELALAVVRLDELVVIRTSSRGPRLDHVALPPGVFVAQAELLVVGSAWRLVGLARSTKGLGVEHRPSWGTFSVSLGEVAPVHAGLLEDTNWACRGMDRRCVIPIPGPEPQFLGDCHRGGPCLLPVAGLDADLGYPLPRDPAPPWNPPRTFLSGISTPGGFLIAQGDGRGQVSFVERRDGSWSPAATPAADGCLVEAVELAAGEEVWAAMVEDCAGEARVRLLSADRGTWEERGHFPLDAMPAALDLVGGALSVAVEQSWLTIGVNHAEGARLTGTYHGVRAGRGPGRLRPQRLDPPADFANGAAIGAVAGDGGTWIGWAEAKVWVGATRLRYQRVGPRGVEDVLTLEGS